MGSLKKFDGSSWINSNLRKLTTDTDTFISLPAIIYAEGSNATIGLKGNTVQSGTPTPDNPVMPQGTGDRTGNLLPSLVAATVESAGITIESSGDGIINVSGTRTSEASPTINLKEAVTLNGTYYVHIRNNAAVPSTAIVFRNGATSITNLTLTSANRIIQITLSNATIDNIQIYVASGTSINAQMAISIEQTESVTPYEPYGYKIPISSANTTTNVYLGEVETTRKVKKLVLTGQETLTSGSAIGQIRTPLTGAIDSLGLCTHYILKTSYGGAFPYIRIRSNTLWFEISPDDYETKEEALTDFKSYLAAQYAAGTPVTVWYVLATEETAVVNEPLMRIGDYADTVSGISIPVTAGGDTLSVGTTVQPSEVTANYYGWHTITVHERESGQWD